jgi:hypothetical protein
MTRRTSFLQIGLAVGGLLIGLSTGVQGQGAPGGVSPFGGELRAETRLKGHVVCVGCRLEEVRKTSPESGALYEFTWAVPGGQEDVFVMKVEWLSEPKRWEAIAGLSHRLVVRASEDIFQQLTAEKNRLQKIELIGLLRSDRIMDIAAVNVLS